MLRLFFAPKLLWILGYYRHSGCGHICLLVVWKVLTFKSTISDYALVSADEKNGITSFVPTTGIGSLWSKIQDYSDIHRSLVFQAYQLELFHNLLSVYFTFCFIAIDQIRRHASLRVTLCHMSRTQLADQWNCSSFQSFFPADGGSLELNKNE